MNTPKILAFAGSTRKESFNKRLAKIAILAADKAGAETTFIDLHDYNMPLYSEDLLAEHGMPDGVIAFKEMLKNHNGFLISSPEYNGSLTGTLKNAIDWATIKADLDVLDLLEYAPRDADSTRFGQAFQPRSASGAHSSGSVHRGFSLMHSDLGPPSNKVLQLTGSRSFQ